jgi:hypothetical protein
MPAGAGPPRLHVFGPVGAALTTKLLAQDLADIATVTES